MNFKNSEFIDIKIFIENGDEPAYETIIEVKYDERLDFIKYEGLVQYGYSCFSKNKSLICKISSGNSLPFEANQKLSFTLRYDGSKLRRISQNKTFDINILAKTISNDTNLSNNVINIVGKLIVQADLFIYGYIRLRVLKIIYYKEFFFKAETIQNKFSMRIKCVERVQ